ncbi:hypothetical protein TRFO_14148 [Tritrichomonas foetus]|uniref:Uncharacterized protein n=1 Tax=Tritrichomonas foetus TaxID=1144522 RepID=A0A1J4KVY4_9EUKA|nr:hypothetical protein TRFO_14148 [Tritrichomonas foetus]|eukprot:OHT15391.1 hypothetical protein TRFO_14148 [Tritrichomonas foetus]
MANIFQNLVFLILFFQCIYSHISCKKRTYFSHNISKRNNEQKSMLFSLNGERKFDNVIKNTPADVGPGMYEVVPVMGNHKKMKAPFGTKGDRSIFPRPKFEAPPPGEYDAKPLNPGLAITSVFMSESRRSTFTSNSNPDPAKYSQLDMWKVRTPQQIYPKKLNKPRAVTGYVGQSDVTCYTMDEAGKWVPCKRPTESNCDIGPGSYDPQLGINTALPISLNKGCTRNVFKVNESFPGPGSYQPRSAKDRLPIKISNIAKEPKPVDGGEPEFVDLKTWAPEECPEGSAVFKSRDIRQTFKEKEATPAPTAYYRPPRQYFSPGDGLGYRAERNTLGQYIGNSVPGPGTYEAKPARWIQKGAKSSLNRAVGRNDIYSINKKENVPGPGKYETTTPWVKPKMRASSVFESQAPRSKEIISDTPGAGQYNPRIIDNDHHVPPTIHESRFSKFGDWVDHNKIDFPAPDHYQKIEMDTGKGVTISRTNRDNPDKDNFPGPGYYNVVHSSLKTKCFNAHVPKSTDD